MAKEVLAVIPAEGETRNGLEIGRKSRGRVIWRCCKECGEGRWVQLTSTRHEHYTGICYSCMSSKPKFHLRAENNGRWRGGVRIHNGYRYLVIFPGHDYFDMAGSRGRIREHRLVMAQHLGRCFESWEVVHHINNICDDNRIENLELLPNKEQHDCIITLQKYIRKLEKKLEELKGNGKGNLGCDSR